ncbi:MAG: response regulator [candidate division Zixibacteria bacterium]|nr:response regulator [candidate division Zixibacteria bacterium]
MSDIRIIIADDEPLARGYLRSLLEPETDCEIVAECGDAQSTVDAIDEHEPDLVFLDVQMPGRDGFNVIEEVGADRMPQTIFVTAFDRYAVQAFDRHALDYLLKPFSQERFQEAMRRVRDQLALKRQADWSNRLRNVISSIMTTDKQPAQAEQSAPSSLPGNGAPLERIPIKLGERVILLKVDEINWIEAADCYVNLHRGKDTFLLRETMSTLEERLDPARFIRIHRASIVNIDFVKEIRARAAGDYRVILHDGTSLTLSRRRKKDIEEMLGRAF